MSAVADPNTGVAVYETTGANGWVVYGGTSVASPLVASIFTLLNLDASGPSFPYSHTSDFYDVTSGKNGSCGSIECTAGAGYDGPTGWGTPNGALLQMVNLPPAPPADAGASVDATDSSAESGTAIKIRCACCASSE